MNLKLGVGYFVLFAVRIGLWLLAAIGIKRGRFRDRALAFIAGSDNRLSLSRLQAFVWTLVIFGSFAAAMAIHNTILAGNPADIQKATNDAATASTNAERAKAKVTETATAAKAASDAKTSADSALQEAVSIEKNLPADASQATKDSARQAVVKAEANAKAKAETQANADKTAADAKAASDKADADAKTAAALVKSYDWVIIPAELLALAGIAIGSGVFSSLISAVNSEDKTACVTDIGSIPQADLKAHFPEATAAANPNALSIVGKGMGAKGAVRLDKDRVPILLWKSDGTQIIVDVNDNVEYKTLTVDTPNGKLCYWLEGKTPGLRLGLPKFYYEFGDLFRDDKNPTGFDLMKFQMFGWTFIAIIIYVWLFVVDLRPDLSSLPVVPSSIVILTGVSQSGYLLGKGVSNVGNGEKK